MEMKFEYRIPIMDYFIDQIELTEIEIALYKKDEIYELLLIIAERLDISNEWITASEVESGLAYVKEFDPFALPDFYKNRKDK